MRVFLLFVAFAAAGLGVLFWSGGELALDPGEELPPARAVELGDTVSHEDVIPLERLRMRSGEGIQVTAAPESFDWPDPEDPRTVVFIPNWFAWEMSAESIAPLPQDPNGQINAICKDVVIRRYRKPRSVAEALALKNGAPGAHEALLILAFEAKEARVSTPQGQPLVAAEEGSGKKRFSRQIAEDSVVRLSGGVEVLELEQKVHIVAAPGRGEIVVRLRRKQEEVRGSGAFTMDHEAFQVQGRDLVLRRLDEFRTHVEIQRDPVVRLKQSIDGERSGGALVDPTTVACAGPFLLRSTRAAEGNETVHAEFLRDVRAEQLGGRRLQADALRLDIEGVPRPVAELRKGEPKVEYELRKAVAEGNVHVEEDALKSDKPRERYTSMDCGRLTYERTAEGRTSTLLEDQPELLVRGLLPLGPPTGEGPGLIRARCRDRIWLGPAPALPVPADFDRRLLRRATFLGAARIERHGTGTDPFEDVIEADQIELVFVAFAGPLAGDAAKAALRPQGAPDIVPVAVFANGSVRISGDTLGATTERIIAMNLHEEPRISLIGKGTRVWLDDLDRREEGPVGAGRERPASAPGAAAAADAGPESTLHLSRVEALGDVRVTTTAGSAAVGIPALLEGQRMSFDDVSRLARLEGGPGAPALVRTHGTTEAHDQELRAQTFGVELDSFRITAEGGVRGRLHLGGSRQGGMMGVGTASGVNARARHMEIRTDERIELRIQVTPRDGTLALAEGEEQIIRVAGPLVAEVRTADMAYDRLEANSLEVALVQRVPTPGEQARAATNLPLTPAAPPAPSESRTPTLATAESELTAVDLETETLQVTIADGAARTLEATGGVLLDAASGRIVGRRLFYEAAAERMQIDGSDSGPVEVWMGETEPRSHVQAHRIHMHLREGKPHRLRAEAHPTKGVFALLVRPRTKDGRPTGEYEVARVRAEGDIIVTDGLLETGKVEVIQFIRNAAGEALGDPLQLRAGRLEVFGTGLLAPDGSAWTRMVASGPRVWLSIARDDSRFQVWGTRFAFENATSRATISGEGPHGVRLLRTGTGSQLSSTHESVTLTYVDGQVGQFFTSGSDVVWGG